MRKLNIMEFFITYQVFYKFLTILWYTTINHPVKYACHLFLDKRPAVQQYLAYCKYLAVCQLCFVYLIEIMSAFLLVIFDCVDYSALSSFLFKEIINCTYITLNGSLRYTISGSFSFFVNYFSFHKTLIQA